MNTPWGAACRGSREDISARGYAPDYQGKGQGDSEASIVERVLDKKPIKELSKSKEVSERSA